LDELREKIDIFVDKQLTDDYMDLDVKSVAARMTIMLSDGGQFDEVMVQFPIGHGKNEKTSAVVRNKFQRNMALMFSQNEIERIVGMVEDEGNEEKNISEFLDLLVRDSTVSSKL